MAASDNGNSRRQRRRSQLKPQPVPARQETSRTPTDRSGVSKRQSMTVLRSNQSPNRNGLSWWQQLFGPTSRRPTPPTRRLQRNKLVSLDNIKPATEFNLSDVRSGRSEVRSGPIVPFSQTEARRNQDSPSSRFATEDISPSKIRNLHFSQPKARERIAFPTDANRRFTAQKLVSLTSPSSRQIQAGKSTQIPGKDQKKRKSTPLGNSTSLPPAKRPPASRKKWPGQERGSFSPLLYSSRLLILGIGLSVVIGTLLSIWNPTSPKTSNKTEPVHSSETSTNATGIGLKSASTQGDNSQALELRQEITSLKTGVQAIANQYPLLTPGIFVLDIDTGAYLDLNADAGLAAASTIKLPILIAFFQDVDAGKIRLDEQLILKKEDIASGSGKMQYKPVGTTYTALETATQMIVISDNTATNMLIDRLGGAEALNLRFREWGLQATTLRNYLPDIEGTNTTSSKELGSLMARLNQGELVSLTSRDRLLDIMQQTQNRSLLPSGLGKGATIAHKTGNIGSLVADVGLIDLPSGKRYIAAVMVKRPRNDTKAAELINKISRLVYQHFSRPASSPKLPSEDSAIPAGSILSPNKPDDRPTQDRSADARNVRD